MKRVVTLIASATEIVAALGCREWIVGRSHECDYPPDVVALPVLTEPKFPLHGTSYEIDARVKAIVAEGASVYRVDAERLKALAPNVIVTQDQCEVCAVSLKDVEAAVCDWMGASAQIVSCKPDALKDVWADIRRVGDAVGVPERADALIGDCQARMNDIAARASRLSARPRVALIEWIDPLMAAGNWMPELVEMAGGVNLFGEAGKHSPWMTFEELSAADPDVIVTMPCGFDIAQTCEHLPALTGKPGFAELRAVREGRFHVTDGNQYFNRPGPRLVESLEILAEMLHPAEFDFGHRSTAWIDHV
ncbi:MAG: cobalamin-binding protein [Chitinophagales bacterium]|nr:cobalamin-binding protein [Hyphomicrobiales bacterium]